MDRFRRLLCPPAPAAAHPLYSAILTNEPITPALFIGGAIILIGVYIGAFAPSRQRVSCLRGSRIPDLGRGGPG